MPNYVKIPKEIIYDTSLTDKRVIIFSYLCARRSLDDTVAFSITELCHWSKLKPNYRDGKINQKYYKTLLLLSHLDYFTEHPDFESLISEHKNSIEYLKVELNIEKFDIPDKFAIIYFNELEAILNYKEELQYSDIDLSRMSSAYILLVLAYIRLNMNRSDDRPLCCYRKYKTISDDIGISERYVSRVVEILDTLNIIKCIPMKRRKYTNNGEEKFITTSKVFADYMRYKKNGDCHVIDRDYDYKDEISRQIKLLENIYV